jgi:hypothetical protein
MSFSAMSTFYFYQILLLINFFLVNAYGLNGLGREAVQLYHQIPIEIIDDIINLCILNACSHSSLIDEARKIFKNIPLDKRTEKIYSTMVNYLLNFLI